MASAAGGSGLLRLTNFGRLLLDAFAEQSAHRSVSAPDLADKSNSLADLQLAAVVAVALFCMRCLMDRVILAGLLRNRTPKDRSKLSEAIFYTVYYIAAFTYFVAVVCRNETFLQEWKFFTNESTAGQIFDPYPPPRSEYVQRYYMQALGFYASALVFLVVFDTRRSDFRQLLLHHVVTVCLITVSYHFSYTRVGAIIIALHDLGDIFLYSATSAHKLKFAGLDTALFAVFAVVFYVTRLAILPRICYGVVIESVHVVVDSPKFNNWAMYFETSLTHLVSFAIMLSTLILLHCFWFTLILRMIYREVFLGKKISDEGDIREDVD